MTTNYHGVGAMAAVKGSNKRRNTWSPKVNQEGQTDLVEYIERREVEDFEHRKNEMDIDGIYYEEDTSATEEVLTSAMDGAMEKLFGITK